jgi:small subunit ribosomal protein S2
MAVITMRQMLEAGVHFGHQTRRWNPKMKRFIFGERNGIYIIDLEQTLTRVEKAYGYVRDLVANGGTILFVGTKKQAQDPIRSYAEKCGMPYVNERWLGGMLTNFDTISKRVGKMLEYERMRDSGEFEAMPKKEALLLTREMEKLQRNLGGLRGLNKRPDAIFVLDTKKEHIAVTEANKLGIPVVAVVDTNVDPELVQYPIPGNDDAIRANSLLARVIADGVEEGRYIAAKRDPGNAPVVRSVEEEAAFMARQAEARNQAARAQAERDARLAAARTATPAAQPAEAPAEELSAEPDAVAPAATPAEPEVATEPAAESPATIAPAATESVGPATAEPAAESPAMTAPAATEPAAAEPIAAEAPLDESNSTDAPAAEIPAGTAADVAAELNEEN